MIVGTTPYFHANKDQLFDNIINGKLKLPRTVTPEAKSLIIGLLNRNPTKRLGSTPGDEGAEQIMQHPFFLDINWQLLLEKKATGLFEPEMPKYTIQDFVDEF